MSKLNPHILSPLQNHIPPQLVGRYWHRGKLRNSSHPHSRARRQGAGCFQVCGRVATASHSTAGLQDGMQTPRFLVESCQPCRGHHPCQELPCCSHPEVQTENCSATSRDPGRADGHASVSAGAGVCWPPWEICPKQCALRLFPFLWPACSHGFVPS